MLQENKTKLYLLFLLLLTVSYGQPPKCFLTKFGTSGMDIAYDVKQLPDSSYWIVGQTSGFGFGSTDVYLTRMDKNGNIIQHLSFGGWLGECGKAIVLNPADSGCFIAGYTQSFGNGGYDMYFLRVDKNGNKKWQNFFGGTDWDFAHDLILGQDGKLYIIGETFSMGKGQNDGIILKVDTTSGSVLSYTTLGGTEEDYFKSVIYDNAGNLLLIGTTKSYGEPNGDIWLVKYNTNLDTLLTRRFGTSFKDEGNALMQHPSGQYWLAAYSATAAGTSTSSANSYVIVLDNNANFLFDQRAPLFYDNSPGYIAVAHSKLDPPDRNLFLTWYYDFVYNNYQLQGYFYIGKTNNYYYAANAFGGTENEYVYGVDATLDGGFIIVGQTTSYNSLNGDVFVLKIDTTYFNYPSIVSVQENPSFSNGGSCVFAYENLLHIKNPQYIKSVEIFDINGKKVHEIKNENISSSYSLQFLKPGVYVIKTENKENSVEHRKIIIE